jgi:hypothetical protein
MRGNMERHSTKKRLNVLGTSIFKKNYCENITSKNIICNKKNFWKTWLLIVKKVCGNFVGNVWFKCPDLHLSQKKKLSFQKTILIRNITRLDGGGGGKFN